VRIIQGTVRIIQGTLGITQGTARIIQGTVRGIQGTMGLIQGTIGIIKGTVKYFIGTGGIVSNCGDEKRGSALKRRKQCGKRLANIARHTPRGLLDLSFSRNNSCIYPYCFYFVYDV
jgi:hypothetical protein